jgi:hypothetical protein
MPFGAMPVWPCFSSQKPTPVKATLPYSCAKLEEDTVPQFLKSW